MFWSALYIVIVTSFCCFWQVDTAWASGDHLGANAASSRARSWSIASIVTGLIGGVAAAVIIGISYGLRFSAV